MPVTTRSMASQPMTPARIERTREPPPAPIKLDLSKMPKKPVSAPFVIAKSTEQQLADALAENVKFREAVNRLVDTHNARGDEIEELKKKNDKEMRVREELMMLNVDARRELYLAGEREARANAEIEALKKENALLKSKNDAYEKKAELANKVATQAEKDALITTMLDTGLDEMVYHLGFCSDVLGDSWVPEYEAGGLAGLKKILRESSTYVHGKSCSTCDKFIGSIHD